MSQRARRRPLEVEIVRRHLAADAEQARRLIESGRVLVGGAPATNAGRQTGAGDSVKILPEPARYVSRAGEKLHGALERFDLDVEGRWALDVGASTGGFTDCLLAHGAVHVVAVDVGRSQLHERLRQDPRVDSRERTDIRALDPASLDPRPSIVTVDVSFISLTSVAAAVVSAAAPDADFLVLVKPQFEVSRDVASAHRGVITEREHWAHALDRATGALVDAGTAIMAAMISPLRGADGNVEMLLHAVTTGGPVVGPTGLDAAAVESILDEVTPR